MKEITQEGLEYLEAYKFYKQGFFPINSGWLNQSKILLDAIEVMDVEYAKIEKYIQGNK